MDLQLLLGYLPHDKALWSQELDKKRSQYNAFKDELLLNPVSSQKKKMIQTILLDPIFMDLFSQKNTYGYMWDLAFAIPLFMISKICRECYLTI